MGLGDVWVSLSPNAAVLCPVKQFILVDSALDQGNMIWEIQKNKNNLPGLNKEGCTGQEH